jgi:hypothetical protein
MLRYAPLCGSMLTWLLLTASDYIRPLAITGLAFILLPVWLHRCQRRLWTEVAVWPQTGRPGKSLLHASASLRPFERMELREHLQSRPLRLYETPQERAKAFAGGQFCSISATLSTDRSPRSLASSSADRGMRHLPFTFSADSLPVLMRLRMRPSDVPNMAAASTVDTMSTITRSPCYRREPSSGQGYDSRLLKLRNSAPRNIPVPAQPLRLSQISSDRC